MRDLFLNNKFCLTIRIGSILFIFCILLLCIGGCYDGNGSKSPISGWIRGQIFDTETGEPVEGALIYTDGGKSTKSLDNGSYLIYHSAGTYSINVQASCYYPESISDVYVGEGIGTKMDFFLISDGSNIPPDPLTLISPYNEEIDVSLQPLLQTDSFSDMDISDDHTKTRWQISTHPSFLDEDLVINFQSDIQLTSLSLTTKLMPASEYYWRARVIDSCGFASEWSDYNSFTTITDTTDTDQDNMPDVWEIQYNLDPYEDDSLEDPDGDSISNYIEYLNNTNPNKSDTIIETTIVGYIKGVVFDINTDKPIEDVQIVISGGIPTLSLTDGSYLIFHPPGTYTLSAFADRYDPFIIESFTVLEGKEKRQDIGMTPYIQNSSEPYSDSACFITIMVNCDY